MSKTNKRLRNIVFGVILGVSILLTLGIIGRLIFESQILRSDNQKLAEEIAATTNLLNTTKVQFDALKNSDQIVRNNELERKIALIQKSYSDSVNLYERIIDLRSTSNKSNKLDESWSGMVAILAKGDYQAATGQMEALAKDITKLEAELASISSQANLPVSNNPPAAGAAKQVVKIDNGSFTVDVISADLRTNKVVVDTASNENCSNNCPVMPLAEFAKRSGAWAAINGPYFCPATYPSCDGKKNSFDTLLMNKNKVYFNSDNNVYSTNPVAIFSGGSRFAEKGSEWGRDTGVDSVIMGRPLLVLNNEVKFGGNNDNKESSKGNRAFIGATDNTVYIGIVRGATVAEAAKVIAAMGIKNAINLDSGGSTAMWSGGRYLAGPGRDLPFGILLVKR